MAGFNPLFIGACWATNGREKLVALTRLKFQSPLHRGMSWATKGLRESYMSLPISFQSPLHRGMLGDELLWTGFLKILEIGFNPLFIGACWATSMRGETDGVVISFNPLFIGACWATSAMLTPVQLGR